MRLFKYFLIGMLCYHILITGLGGFGIESNALIAGAKDIIWILIVVGLIGMCGYQTIMGKKNCFPSFPNSIRKAVLVLCVLCVGGVLYSLINGNDLSQIIIGFKYSLWPLIILVGSVVVGLLFQNKNTHWITLDTIGKIVLAVVIGGFVRQGAKMIAPDWFMHFGYGPVGDFIVGQHPPIRYRTGPGGTMRLQGIFAGPNNYGYFLTAFFSLIVAWCFHYATQGKTKLAWGAIVIYLLSIVLTFSRGAVLGVAIQAVVLVYLLKPTWRKFLGVMIGVGVIGIAALSIRKRSSTVLHFQARVDGIEAIIANPWGYGLGTSGPSVHYEGVYLPENQYLQIALDLGVWGLVLWLGVWGMLLNAMRNKLCCEKIHQSFVPHSFGIDESQWDVQGKILLLSLLLGGVGLALIGMFLHVLEDSMVNYWYLGLLGLTIGMVLGDNKQECSQ